MMAKQIEITAPTTQPMKTSDRIKRRLGLHTCSPPLPPKAEQKTKHSRQFVLVNESKFYI